MTICCLFVFTRLLFDEPVWLMYIFFLQQYISLFSVFHLVQHVLCSNNEHLLTLHSGLWCIRFVFVTFYWLACLLLLQPNSCLFGSCRLLCNRWISCEKDLISSHNIINLCSVLHPIMSCNTEDMSRHTQWNKWDL